MTDVLASFGVDAATVASLPTKDVYTYPKPVAGRVAHIDADFMAYQVSAESKKELDPDDPTPRKSVEDMKHNAYKAVEHILMLSASEKAVLHTTHNSDKGGRDDQAILKEYQSTRKDRDNKPEHLDTLREFLGVYSVEDTSGRFIGRNHTDQEADDGMAQAHYADPENAIVCSMDKDLLMVPGWKLCMYSNKIYRVTDAFGKVWIDEKTNQTTGKVTKKVTGQGTKFFWLQLLMGDAADTISGLPECPGKMWQSCSPTKAYTDTYNKWIEAEDGPKAKALDIKLDKMTAKTKLCGQMLAYDMLRACNNDRQCFELVRKAYVDLADQHGYMYKHWKTGNTVTPTQAMLSNMRLLWMRRYKDQDDVIKWLKELKDD